MFYGATGSGLGELHHHAPGLHGRVRPMPGSGNQRAREEKGVQSGAASAVHRQSSELFDESSKILEYLTGIGRDHATKTL